jgi:ribulose-phosphate 3-epimerase
MSVNPGFGGQSFIESSISKIRDVHALIQSSNHSIELSVDGGINASTAPKVTKAGATILVAGNAIFKERDYAKAVHALKNPLK